MMNWFKRCLRAQSPVTSAARRPRQRLYFEELESRWVPSTSTNWSGYAVTAAAGSVTAVSGSWTVPTVTGSGTSYSSAWVGIDGYNSFSVEQIGTEMDIVNGHAQYSAWYEMYPSAEVTISNFTVKPGDTIKASVNYNTSANDFVLTISDGSENFTVTKSAPSAQRSSAEWIAEAPSSNAGVLPLANFGSVTVANAQAAINGSTTSEPINWTGWQTVNQINMVNGKTGAVEATTSSLTASGMGFTVTYGAVNTPAPTPPAPTPPPSPPPAPTPPSSPEVVTVTSLTGTVNPFGRTPTVTFVATVTAESGSALPTGTVEVMDGNAVLGTAQIEDVHGVAEVIFTVTFPPGPGVYQISVVFVGTSTFTTSTSNTITVTIT